MKLPRRPLVLSLTGLISGSVLFQPQPVLAGTNAASVNPPVSDRFVAAKSPVALFRELLAMDESGREQSLATRSPETRQRILAKLSEYEALDPDERALRLQVTELRWYLLPLLSIPATNRAIHLQKIPDDLRESVEQRLEQWQLLPLSYREEILENDQMLRLYLQLQSSSAAQKHSLLNALPPDKREQVEEGFDRWRLLPDGVQQKTLSQLDQFFALRPGEKEKVLGVISEAERKEMEETLRAFEQLPADKRARCIRAYAKFSNLNSDERRQFLRNAARWQAMTPAERQAWRDLVSQVPLWPLDLPDSPSAHPASRN